MIESFRNVQLFMLLLGGFTCLLILLYSIILRYQSGKRKVALIQIEAATSLLMFSDYFAYVFRGDVSSLGYRDY